MKKYIFLTAAASLLLASCSEDVMDRINEDHGNPPIASIDGKLMITDAQVASGYSVASGDYAFYCSLYTEQLFGTATNQFANAETRQLSQVAGSTTFNNTWNSAYLNLMNLKIILDKCAPGGLNDGAKDLEGMAKLLAAYNWGYLTDMHGDIPCSDALGGAANKQPKIDKQEDIYKHILSYIDDAIADFSQAIEEGIETVGEQDLVYGGDLDKWLAAAHAVKARYKLHMMLRDNGALTEAAAEAQKAIDLGFNGMILDIYDGTDALMSPWAAFQYSRDYIANSKTMYDVLADRNDPRMDIYINSYWLGYPDPSYCTPGDRNQAMDPAGTFGAPLWLSYNRAGKGVLYAAAYTHLLSASEVYFILAEAQARNGQDCTAALTKGVEAAFTDAEAFGSIDQSASAYVASLAAKIAADPVKEVLTQKYIAQGRDEQAETYNDMRRYLAAKGSKNPADAYVAMTNPCNLSGSQNRWPLRLPYGNSDVSANPNVRQAYGDGLYIFTEPIWIFGGNR